MANRTPLDVMIDNMIFWWDRSKDLGELLFQQLNSASPEVKAEGLKTAQVFLQARENAERCAVDAAPYVHPRFSSISVKREEPKDVREVTKDMTAQEAAENYATTSKLIEMSDAGTRQ